MPQNLERVGEKKGHTAHNHPPGPTPPQRETLKVLEPEFYSQYLCFPVLLSVAEEELNGVASFKTPWINSMRDKEKNNGGNNGGM